MSLRILWIVMVFSLYLFMVVQETILANEVNSESYSDSEAETELELGSESEVESLIDSDKGVQGSDLGGDPNLVEQVARPLDRMRGESGLLETFLYDPSGRRDPFAPYKIDEAETVTDADGEALGPLLPLQRFSLSELKLIGIIWDTTDPKALFVDPTGKYWPAVGIDDRVGNKNGYIAAIREGEVIIIETSKGRDGEILYIPQVLKVER